MVSTARAPAASAGLRTQLSVPQNFSDLVARFHEFMVALYRMITSVCAEVAERDGVVKPKEGVTHYKVGDCLVFNEEAGEDGYAVTAPSFEAMYKPVE